jgi:hypothetical protein
MTQIPSTSFPIEGGLDCTHHNAQQQESHHKIYRVPEYLAFAIALLACLVSLVGDYDLEQDQRQQKQRPRQ